VLRAAGHKTIGSCRSHLITAGAAPELSWPITQETLAMPKLLALDDPTPTTAANSTEDAPPRDLFDDLTKLRLDQNFVETAGVRKLLVTIPVRKPNPQDFFRVHAGSDYRANLALIELRDDREIYLLAADMVNELPGEFMMATICTAINRQGVVFLFPVRLPAPDGKILGWHRSAAKAAELATKKWIRMRANMSLGGYDIFEAAAAIPDPKWPELSFNEMLRIAFRDRLITDPDHAVIKRLRGLT
jgi:hypothetical protein